MLNQKRLAIALLSGCLFTFSSGLTVAEPNIDPAQLDFEAYGNGLETGTTSVPTAVEGYAPWAPLVQKSFLSVNFDDNGEENEGFRFIPPDPIGAAGLSRVISVVNTMIESRNKGGAMKWRTSLANFFAPLEPETFTFDPKIVYDQYEDRFIVVTLERVTAGTSFPDPANKSRILLAVSKDGNPKTATAADWHYMEIGAKLTFDPFQFADLDFWADYPGFEVDEEAIYVTANYFLFPPFGGYGGSFVWIVDKDGLYSGGTSTASVYNPAAESGFLELTNMPAQVFGEGGIGGPGSTIGTYLVGYSGLTFGGEGQPEAAQVIAIDDPLGKFGGPLFSSEFVVLGDIETVGGACGYAALADAPQAGGDALIEVNDRRALDAVWRDNSLWMVTTIDPDGECGDTLAGTTKAYWTRMDTTGGPGTITQADGGIIDGVDITSDATTFFPAVAVNRNGVAKFGFSASGPDIYAGAFVTGTDPSYPVGMVGPTETIKAGEDYYLRTFGGPRNRWGDYSGISVDPSNESKFWIFNMYAAPQGTDIGGEFGRWGTAWGRTN